DGGGGSSDRKTNRRARVDRRLKRFVEHAGEAGDYHLLRTCALENANAGIARGTAGHHVVHQQDTSSVDPGAVAVVQPDSPGQHARSRRAAEPAERARMLTAPQPINEHGLSGETTDLLRQ